MFLTRNDKRKIKELNFKNGVATLTTPSGKAASIYINDTNINQVFFQLNIDGKTMFTRGGINKALEVIDKN